MTPTSMQKLRAAGMIVCLAVSTAGCGEFIRRDSAPVTLVIMALEAARGTSPDEFFGGLVSDVALENGGTFNDLGRVSMRLILKDPGQPGITNAPSAINQVTITRYRVVYVRADGRNTPGVDVPYPFDGGATFTVPADGEVQGGFELVRISAKLEPPLSNLWYNRVFLNTIAEVTFFGRDQAGNEVSVKGNIEVSFGNFADEVETEDEEEEE